MCVSLCACFSVLVLHCVRVSACAWCIWCAHQQVSSHSPATHRRLGPCIYDTTLAFSGFRTRVLAKFNSTALVVCALFVDSFFLLCFFSNRWEMTKRINRPVICRQPPGKNRETLEWLVTENRHEFQVQIIAMYQGQGLNISAGVSINLEYYK